MQVISIGIPVSVYGSSIRNNSASVGNYGASGSNIGTSESNYGASVSVILGMDYGELAPKTTKHNYGTSVSHYGASVSESTCYFQRALKKYASTKHKPYRHWAFTKSYFTFLEGFFR
jgi:hypothetical protein